MMDSKKYKKGYFPVIGYNNWVTKENVTKAPIWCSVDMRDGNQSLIIPMSLEEKIRYFKMLCDIGFKEIEVGFPASCDTEYEFLRKIIDDGLIPQDVTIQVLTQSREHIIKKTFEALSGVKNAIIHFYNPTSLAQREQVFEKSKEEIIELAKVGAKLVKKYSKMYDGNYRFEYSPESFTGTEPEYALEVCNSVLDELEPSKDNNVIINLPVTVEMSMPHIYASQVEYMCENLKYREFVTVSVHPHNDRGTGIADTELALLAGADRVEGTLFGNGERTGNVDIVTLGLNMYSHGVDPKLDFSDIPKLVKIYEECTRMHVYERTPYSGALVFAAFSGGHQDAIAKGMRYRQKNNIDTWNVPYIPIDPHDINRTYEADIIRVNSQSGKGGIGYLLETAYGYTLPQKMVEYFSYMCKDISDKEQRELKPEEIYNTFRDNFFLHNSPFTICDMHFYRKPDGVETEILLDKSGEKITISAFGNGSLDAVSNALKKFTNTEYNLQVYQEHSMQGEGSESTAAAYIGIVYGDNKMSWGVGMNTDIIRASADALLCAINNMI